MKHTCPACGTEDVMRFHYHDLMMEAPCNNCRKMVRVDREKDAADSYTSSSFEEDAPARVADL